MKMKSRDKDILLTSAASILVIILFIVLIFNQFMIQSIKSNMITGEVTATELSGNSISLTEAMEAVIPRGTSDIYGQELGVSFETPIESLSILGALDGDLHSDGKLKYSELSDVQKERYILIGSSISCEFCCGVPAIIFSNGQAACGCEHSAAMRGLAKYLLVNHESEYSDQDILEELTKWKSLFFPKQMVTRYVQMSGKSVEELTLPEMVGGC